VTPDTKHHHQCTTVRNWSICFKDIVCSKPIRFDGYIIS